MGVWSCSNITNYVVQRFSIILHWADMWFR